MKKQIILGVATIVALGAIFVGSVSAATAQKTTNKAKGKTPCGQMFSGALQDRSEGMGSGGLTGSGRPERPLMDSGTMIPPSDTGSGEFMGSGKHMGQPPQMGSGGVDSDMQMMSPCENDNSQGDSSSSGTVISPKNSTTITAKKAALKARLKVLQEKRAALKNKKTTN